MIESYVIACIEKASQEYSVPAPVIGAVYLTEKGKVGQAKPNYTTRNGVSYVSSYDLGLMQINTVHLDTLSKSYGVDKRVVAHYLKNDACYNINMGAYLLRNHIERKNSIWGGVAAYHSKTPSVGQAYLQKIREHYKIAVQFFN